MNLNELCSSSLQKLRLETYEFGQHCNLDHAVMICSGTQQIKAIKKKKSNPELWIP